MGCLRRLGCLVLLALLGGVAWVTSDQWRPLLPVWVPGTLAPRAISSVPDSAWAPVTAARSPRSAIGRRWYSPHCTLLSLRGMW